MLRTDEEAVFQERTYEERYRRPRGAYPVAVQLHPMDGGKDLDNVFFEDPATFVPERNQFGEATGWGLFRYAGGHPDVDAMQMFNRRMRVQMLYDDKFPFPEIQFVNGLKRKKMAVLDSLRLHDLRERDYVLHISMRDIPLERKLPKRDAFGCYTRGTMGEDLIYRRFKVSGGTNLDTLQDKVIQPIMGCEIIAANDIGRVRNAHSFVFTDVKDGACFGPADSAAIDMMHVDKTCHDYIAANKYTLAHLVQKQGDYFTYIYDFGDMWDHKITVEKILSVEDSDGRVELYEGRGMCPPEDGKGNGTYNEELYNLAFGTNRQKREVIEKIQEANNYRHLKVSQLTFDPKAFSVEDVRQELAAAFASPASVRSGPKTYTTPLLPEAIGMTPNQFGELKRGQSIQNTFSLDGSFLSETISGRRDQLKQGLCTVCGSPNNLKACAQCRKIFYCCKEHQRADWKTHKPECNLRSKK